MRYFLLLAFALLLHSAEAATTEQPADVLQAPSCRQCGMDRAKFRHSRTVIEYEDGSTVASCSLHCVAVQLANTIDRIPIRVLVADYDSHKLLSADTALWVIGGARKGVMTANAKWSFATREAAERFTRANGGSLASFDEAIKAAYDDMYQDTKMIRELRQMKRLKEKAD